MKIAYLHNLPLEYYPPACNFLDLAGQNESLEIRTYTTANSKGRAPYANPRVHIERFPPPDPAAHPVLRFLRALGWHLGTARSLTRFKPDAVIYVEPHSAIAAWLYLGLFRGRSRLFIHHHEYYEAGDYRRTGMRLPRLGSRLERADLFRRAEWISHTNADRVRLASPDHPDVSSETWRVLPNYPPAAWAPAGAKRGRRADGRPLRLVYVGSASFADTFVEEIVRWTAAHLNSVTLHVCGYNVSDEIWAWLERERFENVTCDRAGCRYEDLPRLLQDFDVGLVLYKGNTKNFVYNVPNKVFEYLRCGLKVWYPREMKGIAHFAEGRNLPIAEVDFRNLAMHRTESSDQPASSVEVSQFTAERGFAPLLERLIPAGAGA